MGTNDTDDRLFDDSQRLDDSQRFLNVSSTFPQCFLNVPQRSQRPHRSSTLTGLRKCVIRVR